MQERLLQSLLIILIIATAYLVPNTAGKIFIKIKKRDKKEFDSIDIWIMGFMAVALYGGGLLSVILWIKWIITGN